MYLKKSKTPHVVMLPCGKSLSKSDLPDPKTSRWVASRKAIVVKAVDAGLIEFEEACKLYSLSHEELDSWRAAVSQFGEGALKTTSLQKFREIEP